MHNFYYVNKDDSLLVSYEKQVHPHSMPKNHFHESYEIYYLLSGKRNYFIKDRTFEISKGSLIFINRYELHRTMDADITNWERILINFRPEFLLLGDKKRIGKLLSMFSSGRNVLTFPVREQAMIEELLFKMVNEAAGSHTDLEEMIAAYLLQLLVISSRCFENTLSADSSSHYIHKKVVPIVQFINSHYMEPLSLNQLAEFFYISPYYLCKIFKESTGFNFVEYLNQVRIREAQTLLRKTGSSVTVISELVGFGSVSQFGRVFKEISGVSPLEYRKKSL